MITDNEVYSDLITLRKKIEFLSNPKNSNSEKANFWKIINTKLNDTIIDYIERDKRSFGW